MKKGDGRIEFARRLAAPDVWVGLIGAKMALSGAEDEGIYLAVTGGRFLPAGRNFPEQTGHNNSKVSESQSQAFSYWFLGVKMYTS